MAELFQEIFDDAKIFESLDKLEKKLVETGASGEEAANGISDAFKEVREFIEGFNEGLQEAKKEIDATKKSAEEQEKANKKLAGSYKDLIGNIQIFGVSLNDIREKALAFRDIINSSSKSTEGAGKAWGSFNKALKVSVIGLVITAVTALIGYFTRFQSGIDKVNQVLAATSAIFDRLITGFTNFGSAISKVFSGDFSGAVDSAKQGFSDISTGLIDAAKNAYGLEAAFQALRDTTIAASIDIARSRVELEKQKAIAEDTNRTFRERIEAQKRAGQIEKDNAETNLALASEELRLAKIKLNDSKDNADAIKAEQEATKNFFDAQVDRNSALSGAEKALDGLRKEQSEAQKKRAEERKKQLEDERKALDAIKNELDRLTLASLAGTLEGDLLAVNLQFDAFIKSAQEQAAKLKEIGKSRSLTSEELKQIEDFGKLEISLREKQISALVQVLEDANEKEKELADKQQEGREALAKKEYDNAQKAFEAAKKLRDEQINLTEQQNEKFLLELAAKGTDEAKIKEAAAELDVFIQAARLQNELEFQQNLLALTDKGNTEQIAQIEATIATIQAKITNLQIEPAKKKGKGIFGLLGIDDENAQQAIKDATAQLIGAINEVSQARIDAAAAEVERIDGLISKQEEAVKAEQEIAKEGLANNVALEKEKLAELKKQRDAAAKEEAKARRAQILLDSVQQLSSLITASANIFKSLSSLPFGLGVPIAIGIIGAMFGAFVSAKARALKAAEAPKLRKGAKLQGRTHENGGTPLTDSDGIVFAEAEKDEWLIGTRPSKEHDQFLSRLNKGEFAGMDLDRIIPKAGYRNPANEAAHRIRDIETRKADISQDQHWEAMKAAYMEGSREIVQAIKEQPEIMPILGGYKRVVKKGNITEIETVIPKT